MVSRGTQNWILGMLTNSDGIVNMYKYGASVTTAIKLFLAYLGLYGDLVSGAGLSPEALGTYIEVVIGVMLPPILASDGSFVGFLDFLFTSVSIIAFGTLLAAGNRELNTPAKYR